MALTLNSVGYNVWLEQMLSLRQGGCLMKQGARVVFVVAIVLNNRILAPTSFSPLQ